MAQQYNNISEHSWWCILLSISLRLLLFVSLANVCASRFSLIPSFVIVFTDHTQRPVIFHLILLICVNSLQNLYMQSYLQTYIIPVHALSIYKYRDKPRNIPLNWQSQLEDSYRFSSERSLFFSFEKEKTKTNKQLIIIYVDHYLITVAEVAQHRTVCDATSGCFSPCHWGAEWLYRENKTLERSECVCTESLIQRTRLISMSATDRVG